MNSTQPPKDDQQNGDVQTSVAGAVNNPKENESKSQNDKRESRWRDPIVWFTGALVIVSALQWHELYSTDQTARQTLKVYEGQLKVMEGQLSEMKSSSEDSKRTIAAFEKLAFAAENANKGNIPSLFLEGIDVVSALKIGDGVSVDISLRVRNSGRVAATNVNLELSYFLQGDGPRVDINSIMKKTCDHARSVANKPTQNSRVYTLAANGGMDREDVSFRVNKSELDKNIRLFEKKYLFVSPQFVACIDYRWDGGRRQLKIVGDIQKVENTIIETNETSIRVDRLRVAYYIVE